MQPEKLSRVDIEGVCGRVSDDVVVALIDTGGTLADLEVAYQWAVSADDVMGKTGHSLTGPAAAIYDILMSENALDDRER
jgi:hypothetical protein